mmetsp:Transcript_23167/g.74537  ORF Transcript_23167/g.74537 Transcript_23167/m.74537 type:complete len:292 (+) Transcript_23167:234-1109(+)
MIQSCWTARGCRTRCNTQRRRGWMIWFTCCLICSTGSTTRVHVSMVSSYVSQLAARMPCRRRSRPLWLRRTRSWSRILRTPARWPFCTRTGAIWLLWGRTEKAWTQMRWSACWWTGLDRNRSPRSCTPFRTGATRRVHHCPRPVVPTCCVWRRSTTCWCWRMTRTTTCSSAGGAFLRCCAWTLRVVCCASTRSPKSCRVGSALASPQARRRWWSGSSCTRRPRRCTRVGLLRRWCLPCLSGGAWRDSMLMPTAWHPSTRSVATHSWTLRKSTFLASLNGRGPRRACSCGSS